MEKRTALVFGATGLVGRALIEELCKSDRYDLIKIFVRSNTDFAGREKVKEFITDFDNLKALSDMISGDDLFICLGTTIKKAGSVARMEEIDRDLPVKIASIASGNSVEKLAVISSVGANPGSSNYYLRIKGEMENGLMKLKFTTLIILRPSMLLGDRNERRAGEEIAKIMMKFVGVLLIGKLSKYKGIDGMTVAKAMLKSIHEKTGTEILESDQIQKIGKD
jgi:uncharacterized protein YbjT (DUF2867 family)